MSSSIHAPEKLDQATREELVKRVRDLQAEVDHLREQLELQQITDGLTGLANRDYFFASATRLWRRARRFNQSVCMMMIDVDDFRKVNEQYGHLAGDMVLTGLSDMLRSIVRDYDLLARFGEEEFVIAMDNSQADTPEHLARRIHDIVARTPITVNDRTVPVSVTIGVATGRPEDLGDKPEPLVRGALEATEIARRKGHRQFHLIRLDGEK